jgi:hypothetical protein
LEIEILATNGKTQHLLMMDPVFVLSGVGGGEFFLKLFLVLNVFSTCFHHVPLRFPKFSSYSESVPNSTSILSHMVCPKFNSHIHKLPLGKAQWSKKVTDRSMNMAKGKKKNKFWAHP